MPRDGAGTYSLPVNSVDPAVTGTTISTVAFNQTMNDLAIEVTDSMDRSGKGAMLAALAMGGFKITNVGAPVINSDAVRTSDLTLAGDVTSVPTVGSNATTVAKIQGVVVNGTTGTNKNVFDTSPTIATPTITAPTITGISLISGRIDGNAPAAGLIGEQFASQSIITGAINNVAQNIVSINLTAGNWLIWGAVAATPQGGATITYIEGIISTTSGVESPVFGGAFFQTSAATTFKIGSAVPTISVTNAGAVTYYLVTKSIFSGGSMNISGYLIGHRFS